MVPYKCICVCYITVTIGFVVDSVYPLMWLLLLDHVHNNQEATSTAVKDNWMFTGVVDNEICSVIFNLWAT